jgi:hypothetical protein
MNRLRVTSLALACALLAPALANAKPLDAATAHARIMKRGVGSWVCVQEANGVALVGRVVNIGDDSVGLQLANYPEITPVNYTDIVGLRFGISRKGFWTLVGVGIGASVAMTVVGIHEVDSNKPKPLPQLELRW